MLSVIKRMECQRRIITDVYKCDHSVFFLLLIVFKNSSKFHNYCFPPYSILLYLVYATNICRPPVILKQIKSIYLDNVIR